MRFPIWKWRKHPIKRDKRGRPLRQQAFELFDKKLRPSQIYKQQLLPAKLKHYFVTTRIGESCRRILSCITG